MENKKSVVETDFLMFDTGADGRDRTCDLLVTNELLYQLSYIGLFHVILSILVLFRFCSPIRRASSEESTNLGKNTSELGFE